MWELYEQRLEAEHYLGREIRARTLIDRLISMPAETSEEAFRAELAPLSYPDLRAFSNRAIELTEGPPGEGGGAGDAGEPHRDRLLVLRAVGRAVLNEAAAARTDHLAPQDVEPVRACTPIDEQMGSAFRSAVSRRATAEDADILAAAARGYEAISSRASLSAAGLRVLQLRKAQALDGLARASETNYGYAVAEPHFRDAAALYAQAGNEDRAAACLRERAAAAQRHVPDADTRLKNLLADLRVSRSPSVDRATVLVSLAELASGNHDDFEARKWLNDAVTELAAAGYAIPEQGDTDRAVTRWMEAIPPGDGEDPIHFLRQIDALLPLHFKVAALQITLAGGRRGDEGRPAPDGLSAAQPKVHLNRLNEIISQGPAHAEAVQARLEAQLGRSSPLGPGADQSRRATEFTEIMTLIDNLRDLTAHAPADVPAEAMAQWRLMAGDCIARARAFGRPVNLAQALGIAASVEEAADDFGAAVNLLEAAYQQVRDVPGKIAADEAIIALSRMAKLQFAVLEDRKAALATASSAIELIERDRYRVSAPFQQAALLEPHGDLFTIGIFIAWKIATDETAPNLAGYDRMLQLMELSKARASVRQRRLELWDLRAISRGVPDASVPKVTLAGVQAALRPDEAVIYYYWLQPLVLLVVTIAVEGIAVDRKLVAQDQRAQLEHLIKVLGSLRGSNRVIVSPHRLLHWYPFAAMPYHGQPLVRSFALRHAPNLTSLLVPRPDPGTPRMTALAVSEFPGRPHLGKLPRAHQVAADITDSYTKAGISSVSMPEPTRGQVLAGMRDRALAGTWCLHLDTHGYSLMDEIAVNAPLESVLELADNSVDGYEIAAASLECEVVVLTACFAGQRAISGRGRAEQPGDELFGISAAFLDARCRSVLAPAWPADDKAIALIMTAFHRYLAQGSPADIALAQAQRAFLDAGTAGKWPAYYWAPLMLTAIGRPMPIPRTLPPDIDQSKETLSG